MAEYGVVPDWSAIGRTVARTAGVLNPWSGVNAIGAVQFKPTTMRERFREFGTPVAPTPAVTPVAPVSAILARRAATNAVNSVGSQPVNLLKGEGLGFDPSRPGGYSLGETKLAAPNPMLARVTAISDFANDPGHALGTPVKSITEQAAERAKIVTNLKTLVDQYGKGDPNYMKSPRAVDNKAVTSSVAPQTAAPANGVPQPGQMEGAAGSAARNAWVKANMSRPDTTTVAGRLESDMQEGAAQGDWRKNLSPSQAAAVYRGAGYPVRSSDAMAWGQ